MKITLHFGNIDMPYVNENGKAPRGVTTFKVAGYLENKYHVYEHYWELEQKTIVPALENSIADALESVLMGAPLTMAPFAAACTKLEAGFKAFIEANTLATYGYPGIPTKASLDGVRNGVKHPGKPRASFFDTGLYKNTFKVWVDGYA